MDWNRNYFCTTQEKTISAELQEHECFGEVAKALGWFAKKQQEQDGTMTQSEHS